MVSNVKRPLGVTLLAIFCLVGAVVSLYYTATLVAEFWSRELPWPQGETWWETLVTHRITITVVMLALVVFYLRLGWGLWRLENSARIGMALLILLTVLFQLGVEAFLYFFRYSSSAPGTPGEQILYFGYLTLNVLIVIYLFLPSTRRAFGQSRQVTHGNDAGLG